MTTIRVWAASSGPQGPAGIPAATQPTSNARSRADGFVGAVGGGIFSAVTWSAAYCPYDIPPDRAANQMSRVLSGTTYMLPAWQGAQFVSSTA